LDPIDCVAHGENAVIRWGWDGFINEGNSLSIKLTVDLDNNGTVDYEVPVVPFCANTGFYQAWMMPTDVPITSHARIVIKDEFADYGTGNEVIGSSGEFTIVNEPTITVTGPNGGEDYVIDSSTMPIRWESKGLSITNVKIELSSDNFATTYLIVASTPNTGSYDWYIKPDANVPAGANVRVRVSRVDTAPDYGEVIRDDSDSAFIIRSGFVVTSPVAGAKWATNEIRNITWTTKGYISNVNLYYKTPDMTDFTLIAESAPNTGTYAWKVPDNRAQQVVIRVQDPTSVGTSVLIQNDSPAFSIIWYTLKFYIIDKDTYGPLTDLSVVSNADSVQNYPGWSVTDYSVDSPVSRDFPYGHFSTTWSSKPTSTGTPDYFDRGIEFDVNEETAAKGIMVEMENRVSATIEWHVILSNAYTASDDTLSVSTWLERRGKLQEPIPMVDEVTSVRSLNYSNFKSCTLKVYDYDTDTNTPVKTFEALTPDENGLYKFRWASTGLVAGKTYFVRASITYGTGDGNAYTSGATFDITATKAQSELATAVQGVSDQVQVTAAQIQAAIVSGTSEIKSKVDEVKTTVETKVDAAKAEIKQDTARILTAAETTIPTQIKETVVPSLRSEILNRESTVRLGSKIMLRYRTYSGLGPVVNVYNPRNMLVVSQAPMKEVAGSDGIYEYQLNLAGGWSVGDYTIVCSEPTKGTMDALLISAIRTDLEDISGQVATILGTTNSLSDLKDVADTLNSQFSIIESALGKIGTDFAKGAGGAGGAGAGVGGGAGGGEAESVHSQLVNISKELKNLGATQDVNLSKLLDVAKEKSQDIKYLKNKTQQLKAAMTINTKMVDNIANKPVTQTWFEYK
jgi:hypothetical protein